MNRNRSLRIIPCILLCAVFTAGCWNGGSEEPGPFEELRNAQAKLSSVGQGVVATSLEETGYQPPQANVFKTDRVTGPIPTNDWWSSLAWTSYSGAIYPHPLVVRVNPDGLNVAYPKVKTTGGSFHALYKHDDRDLIVGGRDFSVDSGLLDGFGDWNVDMLLPNKEGNRSIRATVAHGSPYVFLEYNGVEPLISLSGNAELLSPPASNEAILRINEHIYAFYAPTGTAWTLEDAALSVDLPEDRTYVSLALLPDSSQETLDLFRSYAYSFITDTKVNWNYDKDSSKVETVYEVKTEPIERNQEGTLFALYPHQWKHTNEPFLPYLYESPRGPMKLVEGESFETEMTYTGILPYLPNLGADQQKLNESLAAERIEIAPSPEGEGTYWFGKNYNRLSNLIPIARMLQDEETETALRETIQQDMERTFKQSPEHRIMYYDRLWGTLNVYPTQFGADMVLNDHHFHYGYWVYAAAMLAYEDPKWASHDEMGGMVELLIRDYANWERDTKDSDEQLFPFLRNFDPYAGHSWASGNATDITSYSPGNNQESSSEALMSATALILWGDATNNEDIRDTGIYLYTTEVEAVKHYWFDTEGEFFPEEYEQNYAPIVVSAGGEFRTWWTTNPEEVYGINILPVTGGSLYLGHDPDYAKQYYDDMTALNGGPPQEWKDILWMHKAFYAPEEALAEFEAAPPIAEYGESNTHTYHWLSAMNALGTVDLTVIADTPLYAAFDKNGTRTFVAFNGGSKPITVTFKNAKDGRALHKMKVPPKELTAETVE